MAVTRKQILEARPSAEPVSVERPYFWLHETEPDRNGFSRTVNTLFLSNRECAFKCLMCDLWKKTVSDPTPEGAIPRQIRFGLSQLPPASYLKLYNNGNFFDRKAIPAADHPLIRDLVQTFDHLIVENHPKLCTEQVLRFADGLQGSLEVAMGLETIHPEILPRLNKQMTADDFERATALLHRHGIATRAFVLFHPPYLTDPDENLYWTLESIRFARRCGVDTCSIIPVRSGNGIMERLEAAGDYVRPSLTSFETVVEQAHKEFSGRIFADIWDLRRFSDCPDCFDARRDRLNSMNLDQSVPPPVSCHCRDTA